MSRYRKIDPRFWKDEKVMTLTPHEKLIALYLFTGQSNRIGLFNFSPGAAAEDLGVAPETFSEGFLKPFGNVCRTLNFGWDEILRVLYLPTWWRYNCPENPNVLKACLADLHEVPKSRLITDFSTNLQYLPKTFHQTFLEGLPKPSPQRMADQEQDQEQEQDTGAGISGAEAPASFSPISKKGNPGRAQSSDTSQAPVIPAELKPAVERIIARLNDLAGTAYKADSKIVLKGIVSRLKAGASESDCLTVVEDRWHDWSNNPEMLKHFNPETLFREDKFEKYLNAARINSNNGNGSAEDPEWHRRTFING